MVLGDAYRAGGAQEWGPRVTLPILAPTDLPLRTSRNPTTQVCRTCQLAVWHGSTVCSPLETPVL